MTPQPLSHARWFAQFDVYLHQQGLSCPDRAPVSHRLSAVPAVSPGT